MWPFSSGTKSFLGVDFGSQGIKIVELKEEKNRPVLFTYGLSSGFELNLNLDRFKTQFNHQSPADQSAAGSNSVTFFDPKTINEAAEVIKAICKESKTLAKVAVVSLPVSAVFHTIVTLPAVKKEEFDRLMRAEVKKLLPYPLEQAQVEYEVLKFNETDKVRRILVNAAPTELVKFYTEIFRKTGLTLVDLEPESMALARALIGKDQAVAMIIDMGAKRTNFFIVDEAVPITHHSLEVGGTKINAIINDILHLPDASLTEQVKHDIFSAMVNKTAQFSINPNNFIQMFASVVEPIMKEIEYSFDLYLRQSGNEGKRPEKIILTGGASFLPYLSQYIAEKFQIKCYIGDPWGRVVYQEALKPILNEIAPRMGVSIGLALRKIV